MQEQEKEQRFIPSGLGEIDIYISDYLENRQVPLPAHSPYCLSQKAAAKIGCFWFFPLSWKPGCHHWVPGKERYYDLIFFNCFSEFFHNSQGRSKEFVIFFQIKTNLLSFFKSLVKNLLSLSFYKSS